MVLWRVVSIVADMVLPLQINNLNPICLLRLDDEHHIRSCADASLL